MATRTKAITTIPVPLKIVALMATINESAAATACPTGVTEVALFVWFSPAFPIGGFAYSHGLETAVAEARVLDEDGLQCWIQAVLTHGAGWSDAILLRLAYGAVLEGEPQRLRDVAALNAALAPSKERLAEAMAQGAAFVAAVQTGWPDVIPANAPKRLGYAVAAGIAAAGLRAELRPALAAYLTGFSSNLAAAGVRLGLCGQIGAVRILANLGMTITKVAESAASASEDDLGGCAVGADIASSRHEILVGRLFLS